MTTSTTGVPAPQTTKLVKKASRYSKSDRSDRDLASAGGAAPDQGSHKETVLQHKAHNSSSLAGREPQALGGSDAPAASLQDKTGLAAASASQAAISALNKHENPARWAKALGSVAAVAPSATVSMAPKSKQQPHAQPANQPQDRGQQGRPALATSAPAGRGISNEPAGNNFNKPGQQVAQQQARPVRVSRTVSNSSNEATTPVHGSQRGAPAPPAASKLQPQQQQADAGSNTAPKSGGLSYAAAAVHKQPVAPPAYAQARPKKPAPAAVPAAPQEPFPPLSPAKAAAGAGWGDSAVSTVSPAKPWGPKAAEQTAEVSNGYTQPAPPAAAAPAAESKPAAEANGSGKPNGQGSKQATSSTAPPPPAAAAASSRQDSFSRPAGRGGGHVGGRGRGGASVAHAQWAPKPTQADAQEQPPSDSWARNAAAYADQLAGKAGAQNAQPPQQQQHEPTLAAWAQQQQQQRNKDGKPTADKDSSTTTASSKDTAVQQQSVSAAPAPEKLPKPDKLNSNKAQAPAPAPAAPAAHQAQGVAEPHTPAAGPQAQPQQQQQPQAPAVHSSTARGALGATGTSGFATASQYGPAASSFSNSSSNKPGPSTVAPPHSEAPAPAAATSTGAPAGAPPAAPAAGSNQHGMVDAPLANKQPLKPPSAQHSPAFKLPSSQAVNMAAVSARSHGSDDSRLGAPHGYGSMDSYGVSAGYQGMGAPSAYQQTAAHMQAAALSSFLYQQPQASQMPTAVGSVDFLLGGSGSSSAFREAPYAAPDAPIASQQYGGMGTSSGLNSGGLGGSMAGPQAPAAAAAAVAATAALQHSMAAGSRSGASGGNSGRNAGGNSASALAIKRHLSADAPPFEAPSRHNGAGSGTTGSGGSSAADTNSNAGGGANHRRGGRSAASSFSRQLFELAEQVQAEESSRDAERAEASKQQAELQDKLATERASRTAAEARVAALEQELEASHQRNKDIEQQLSVELSRVSQLQADMGSKAAEAEEASGRAASLTASLHSTQQQLDDAQAHIASLQQQCQALEHEKLQLEHRISTQGVHAARVVADAAAAAAATIPSAGLHSGSGLHGLVGPHSQGGIAARLPPPGFDPMPLPPQQQQQPTATPAAAEASGAGVIEMNEHQLVLIFLEFLYIDPSQAVPLSETLEWSVNLKLMPLNWDEHYAPKYGSMHKFMADRPAVFGVRSDGAVHKFNNSEQLVHDKMAQDAAAAAAAAVQPAPAAADSSSQGAGGFIPAAHSQAQAPHQQQPQGPPSGGWHGHFQPMQQQQHLGPSGPHSSGPSSGHAMHSMPMGMHMPSGLGPGPLPPHLSASMGMPYYPHPMGQGMQGGPVSMPMAGPSMPFPVGQHNQPGW